MNLVRALLANARGRASRLFVPSSRQSTLRKQYLHQQFVEEPNDYNRGGYHPVSLGDTFHSERYTVLRKLGYGEYSTVWLARDLKCQRYVALKMLRADSYGGPQPIFEREILEKIREVSPESSHEGSNYISPLIDMFTHGGPNGDHVCLVFDVLGYHLGYQAAKYEDGRLPLKTVKEIVRQLLKGLDFLHTECGVIHTDLKPTNILLELETPNDTILKYLESVTPRTSERPNGAIVPLQEVIKTPLVSEMESLHVRIIDFGVDAYTLKNFENEKVVQFVHGYVMFREDPSEEDTWTVEDDHLARIVEILGPIPSSLLKQGCRTAEFFDEQGEFLRIPNLGPTSLERLLNGDRMPRIKPSDMSDDEVVVFIDFVRGMLQIDPKKRKSAAQLLQHEWLS
ncbi:hypothetical protein E4U30_008317 [Claviceps sp. LM220 group G6]|nr:hypothetical protein E4U30_008317 [Claviceps sp. LM220 group G6]